MLIAPRHLSRLRATVGLFTRYGLLDFARAQRFERIVGPLGEDDAPTSSPEQAGAFRERLVELGPAYIKLGQVLSTRPDLMPAAYITELERLQDDVAPVPFGDIRTVVETELGARLSKLFASFDETPLAAASLGQVHAASLRDGREITVKVQRPGIRAQLADDIEFFHELALFLSAHTEAGARVDLAGIIQQLEGALADELDYRVEARNAAAFRRSLAELPRILIPRVIEAYSTEKVLTTERLHGVKVSDLSPLNRLEHDFRPVAEDLARAYLKQITIDGHFHADPHPGNVFVVLSDQPNPRTPSELRAMDRRAEERDAVTPLARIEADARRQAARDPGDIDARLALIDFGMTARLSPKVREQVTHLLMCVADNRGDEAGEVMIELGTPLPTFERDHYLRAVAEIMGRHYQQDVELNAGRTLFDLIDRSFRDGLRLPGELTLLGKALLNLDAVTRAIDPTFSPLDTIREYGARIASDRARREMDPRRVFQWVAEGTELARLLPHRLDIITKRLAANELEFRLGVPELTRVIEAMQKLANRVLSGLVLAGLLVASAMLMPYRRVLGTIGFVFAGALGLWMVLAILWNDRKTSQRLNG